MGPRVGLKRAGYEWAKPVRRPSARRSHLGPRRGRHPV